jgi:hypothetical protein
MKEELKKVQSSAAILERQRSPGIGYWSSRQLEGNPAASRSSIGSIEPSDPPSRITSPAPAVPKRVIEDQEVNLEYLRNVIFQFLEHQEMRVSLCKQKQNITGLIQVLAQPGPSALYYSSFHATGNPKVDIKGVECTCCSLVSTFCYPCSNLK